MTITQTVLSHQPQIQSAARGDKLKHPTRGRSSVLQQMLSSDLDSTESV